MRRVLGKLFFAKLDLPYLKINLKEFLRHKYSARNKYVRRCFAAATVAPVHF